jgi:hypothetical protein
MLLDIARSAHHAKVHSQRRQQLGLWRGMECVGVYRTVQETGKEGTSIRDESKLVRRGKRFI